MPIITAFYAALLALIYLPLSLRIPILRMKHMVGLGDGDVPELARWIRVHGNFGEYVPIALLLLMLAELLRSSGWLLHIFGITLIVARLLHVRGLSQNSGTSRGRFLGTVLTLSVIGLLALLLLILSTERMLS